MKVPLCVFRTIAFATNPIPKGALRHVMVKSAYPQSYSQSFGPQRSQTVVVQIHVRVLQVAKERLDRDGLGVVAGLQVELCPRQVRLIGV